MQNVEEKVKEVFDEVGAEVTGIRSMVLASLDGLPIVSNVESTEHKNRISAMVSALVALARRMGPDLKTGELEGVSVDFSDGKIFCYNIEDRVIMAVATQKNINLGLLNLIIPGAIEKIKGILSGG